MAGCSNCWKRFSPQKVMETAEGWTPEEGTPQGAVISPLLSNIYLDPLDHLMAEAGFEMVRYADDFVILCRSEAEARASAGTGAEWTATAGLHCIPRRRGSWTPRNRAASTFWAITSSRAALAPAQEPGQAQRHDSAQNPAHQRA